MAGSTAGAYDLQYFTTDHLGSVRVVTDGSGNVVFSSGYTPYGTGTNTAGSAMNEFRFSGKEAQPQAGLLDFGARFYDPRSASWLSPDPKSEKYYSVSPYAYCANDPLDLVDPEGKQPFLYPYPINPTIFLAIALEHSPFQKTRTIGYVMQEPHIAYSIGSYKEGRHNISTIAGNYTINVSRNAGFTTNLGSEENAFRHTLWQAIITNKFGVIQASRVGLIHENKKDVENLSANLYSFPKREAADAAADLRNNIIGQEIGNGPQRSNIELAIAVINYMHEKGVWTSIQTESGMYTIFQTKITDQQWRNAIEEINKLDMYGKEMH